MDSEPRFYYHYYQLIAALRVPVLRPTHVWAWRGVWEHGHVRSAVRTNVQVSVCEAADCTCSVRLAAAVAVVVVAAAAVVAAFAVDAVLG